MSECWEFCGDFSLQLVQLVQLVDGYSWKMDGPGISRRISAHCKCFSIRIPFLFQYRSILCDEIQKWNVKSSIEVQDEKTCRTVIIAVMLLLCYYCCYVELLYYRESAA